MSRKHDDNATHFDDASVLIVCYDIFVAIFRKPGVGKRSNQSSTSDQHELILDVEMPFESATIGIVPPELIMPPQRGRLFQVYSNGSAVHLTDVHIDANVDQPRKIVQS